jgi:hypothetical protein
MVSKRLLDRNQAGRNGLVDATGTRFLKRCAWIYRMVCKLRKYEYFIYKLTFQLSPRRNRYWLV